MTNAQINNTTTTEQQEVMDKQQNEIARLKAKLEDTEHKLKVTYFTLDLSVHLSLLELNPDIDFNTAQGINDMWAKHFNTTEQDENIIQYALGASFWEVVPYEQGTTYDTWTWKYFPAAE